MGAWDFGSFDNDDASDWLYDLEESSDTSVISDALNAVTEIGEEDLEAPDCSVALAAAEIIAALRGHPMATLPDNAAEWVENHHGLEVSSLVPIAKTVIRRIRTNSELKDLWEESGDLKKWLATLDDLTSRLSES